MESAPATSRMHCSYTNASASGTMHDDCSQNEHEQVTFHRHWIIWFVLWAVRSYLYLCMHWRQYIHDVETQRPLHSCIHGRRALIVYNFIICIYFHLAAFNLIRTYFDVFFFFNSSIIISILRRLHFGYDERPRNRMNNEELRLFVHAQSITGCFFFSSSIRETQIVGS